MSGAGAASVGLTGCFAALSMSGRGGVRQFNGMLRCAQHEQTGAASVGLRDPLASLGMRAGGLFSCGLAESGGGLARFLPEKAGEIVRGGEIQVICHF